MSECVVNNKRKRVVPERGAPITKIELAIKTISA